MFVQLKPFIEEGIHPQIIARAVRKTCNLLCDKIRELAVTVSCANEEEHRSLLRKCASTALSSKLVAEQKDFFSKLVVDAVFSLDRDTLPLNMIGVKKVAGGAVEDSMLVEGVGFKKTFSYAGFEMQQKRYEKPLIALLNIELELKAEKENAEVRLDNVEEYQRVVDAEWRILYEKLEAMHKAGAKVVLSKLPIGDVATQWFADRDMFCAGRVADDDLRRTQKACGGAIITTVQHLKPEFFGKCELFEEVQIGADRYNLFTGVTNAKACTIIIRGGAEQFIEETQRSLHDAIMIVRRAVKNDAVVAGGGAIEMELSRFLREHARTIAGKEQYLAQAIAKALEVIPRQLCDNAGFDSTNVLNKLRKQHALPDASGRWFGVDVAHEDVTDNFIACVWEPAVVKLNAITAASEACCLILTVDETIKNPKSENKVGDDRPYKPH